MPDITMCEGGQCPLKENCYRFKATPDEFWQSYFMELPYVEIPNDKSPSCERFWKMKGDTPE